MTDLPESYEGVQLLVLHEIKDGMVTFRADVHQLSDDLTYYVTNRSSWQKSGMPRKITVKTEIDD
jgi:hypothetical protein